MSKKILILIIVILVSLGGFLLWKKSRQNTPFESGGSQASTESSDLTYKNSQYGFSFQKPEGYTVGEFDQDEGKMILVQMSKMPLDTKNAVSKGILDIGFQILISPFDEADAVITKARINKEIPDMKVENSAEILVADSKGLQFESNNSAFSGKSFEVWFVRGTDLYQISGYIESEQVIKDTLNSWKFE